MIGVGFLFSFYKSLEIRDDKYNYKYGQQALEQTGDDKFLFFYGRLGFHQKKPVYKVINDDYNIWFYEIVRVNLKEDDYIIDSYLYPVITSVDHNFGQKGKYYVLNFNTHKQGDESVIPYYVVLHSKIDIANIQTEEGKYYMAYDEVVDKEIYQIELLQVDQKDSLNYDELLKEDITILGEDFYIKNSLIDYFENKKSQNKPLTFTEEDRLYFHDNLEIYSKESHNPSEFNYIFYIWMSVYFVIFFIASYFVFFYKRKEKKLGKIEPTESLIDSIEE